jgi:hypothetical protein
MKDIFLKSILSIALVVSFISSARGQQTNIHVSMPPLIDPDMRYAQQISASYIRMHGERIDLNGIDINTLFRKAISHNRAYNSTLGAALLGSYLGGEMDIDTSKRDVSGVVLHGSYNLEYLVVKKPSSSLVLFMGMPLSFGNFIIETEKEDVTMYNLMAGLQGGAQVGFKIGDFIGSPFVMVNLMGGYRERYDGGVYFENLNSGSIPIFAVISSGLEIIYLPFNLKLSGMYQRTFESGDNKPIDTSTIQLGISF